MDLALESRHMCQCNQIKEEIETHTATDTDFFFCGRRWGVKYKFSRKAPSTTGARKTGQLDVG